MVPTRVKTSGSSLARRSSKRLMRILAAAVCLLALVPVAPGPGAVLAESITSTRNAFRHAHAERVEVEIRYDDEQFRLRVRDDGKGSERRCSQTKVGRDTTACAACMNAPN